MTLPTLDRERAAWARGARIVAGLDEVGRGALAGPVVAAAIVLRSADADILAALAGVRDSKQLTGAERTAVYDRIVDDRLPLDIGVGTVLPIEIDALGIARANDLAMVRAIADLPVVPDHVLVDGLGIRLVRLPQQAVVGGDRAVLSIAAASIVAKVRRDAAMIDLGRTWPGYGFDRHKGYGTADHLTAIRRLGPTVQHRLTWAPVARCLQPAPVARPFQPRLAGWAGTSA